MGRLIREGRLVIAVSVVVISWIVIAILCRPPVSASTIRRALQSFGRVGFPRDGFCITSTHSGDGDLVRMSLLQGPVGDYSRVRAIDTVATARVNGAVTVYPGAAASTPTSKDIYPLLQTTLRQYPVPRNFGVFIHRGPEGFEVTVEEFGEGGGDGVTVIIAKDMRTIKKTTYNLPM